ncbi:MAG: hypothetical protein J4431_02750 [Candidatus Aenigmarchaeota archaeon]|nr:hypothetical protein [Candidatus Aenigmarchaeota archaeon]
MLIFDAVAGAVNRHFNFRKVRISSGPENGARIDGDELLLTLNVKDPFLAEPSYAALVAVRETYLTMYGRDGLPAELLANRSVIRDGMAKELAGYYFFLLTERKDRNASTLREFVELNVPHLSFAGLDEGQADIFRGLAESFTAPPDAKKKTERLFLLCRDPYRNYEELKKEAGEICKS